jgi:hypothetical protein
MPGIKGSTSPGLDQFRLALLRSEAFKNGKVECADMRRAMHDAHKIGMDPDQTLQTASA